MDRRKFLKIAGAGTSGLAVSTGSAISIEKDTYRNSELGLSLSKPSNWKFETPEYYKNVMEDQASKLAHPVVDTVESEQSLGLILSVSKYEYDLPYDLINPEVTIWVEVATASSQEEFFRSWERGVELNSPNFGNLEIISGFERSKVGGIECLTLEAAVDLELKKATLRGMVREYYLLVKGYEVTITVGESFSNNSPNTAELDYIISSISFSH